MAFKYRLQKVLNFRVQKKDEQLEVVKQAEMEVRRIQSEIDKTHNEAVMLRKNMYSAHHTMMENYDVYIKHLYTVIENLEEEKKLAIIKLEEEKVILVELEKAVKVLEKHKEKAHQQYLVEQNKAEMKQLDEIAGQRYFAQSLERKNEEEEEEAYLAKLERLSLDEY